MTKVSIWDMDFYYKKSFQPNPIAMKISSFHKQQKHIVNFVQEEYHQNLSYDIFYIIREKKKTPKPKGKLIDDNRVKLIGKTFRFFDNYWKPTQVISAVRPDYLLYPENKRNAYYNAHIVQFFHEGKKLNVKQPFENSIAHHKKTLVVDSGFWEADDKDIISCLKELTNHKNIAFLYPINLKKILENEIISFLFKSLKFSQGTMFKFRNNYGQEKEEAIALINYIASIKKEHPHVRFSNIPFKALTKDHSESVENGLYDLERCLFIIDKAKREQVHVRIVSPRNRFDSPFWYYFEVLEYWMLYMENLSYVEIMLNGLMKRTGADWDQILNNPIRWSTPNCHFLLALMTKKREWIEKYGFRRWGTEEINFKLIEWDQVNKYKGKINEDFKKMEE